MARAVVGAPVQREHDGPPWIVVAHTLCDVLVSRWPGRLWRVEILRRADEQPVRGAGYTRAVAVKAIEELPPAALFGPHGTEVCRVISVAERISQYDADRLQSGRDGDADAAYTRAWKKWIAQQDGRSHHVAEDHRDTLAVPSIRSGSPINHGLSVIYSTVANRARDLEGDAAFVSHGDEESLVAPWSAAATALLHAGMALGAPDLVSSEDRSLLLSAFSMVSS